MDPRTYDSPRAQRLYLDSPPNVSQHTQPQGDLYNMQTNHIGYYKDYQSIYGGDIVYYTDVGNAQPYSTPLWIIPSYIEPQILVDPMGSIKPYYKRIPIFQNDKNNFQYSFDQDQCEFREDLIALQTGLWNRSSFENYQFYNNPQTYYPYVNMNKNGNFPFRKINS
jgi:hypothetical protein